MKKIIIPFSNSIDTNSSIANIDNFKWCNNYYKPDTKAYLAYNNEKIYIKLISYEKERRAECNADETKICTDSCMEFFVKPFNDDERYLNFEFNSKGFMILHIGKDRHNRGALTDEYRKFLNVKAINEIDFWGITFEIPFSVFCSIFNKENTFVKGYSFTANFYKCADKFKFPHYGMWNEVDVDHPDYHLSQFFGEIVLG